jgi:hypothetical protein
MKLILALLGASLLLPLQAFGEHTRPPVEFQPQQQSLSQASVDGEGDLESYGHYVNKSGVTVHSPSKTHSGQIPPGASAKCRDGSYNFSQHHSGTCSHHGGVEAWL